MRPLRIGVAAAAAAFLLAGCGGEGGGSVELTSEDRALGDPDAPITMVEYASITCGNCKYWHDEVWPLFKEEFVDTGKVRFVFRELPTAPLDVSMAGFLVARCAPEERYFNVIDILFERQETLFTTQDRRGELLAIARAAGLSEDQFNACIRDEDEIARINAQAEEAARVHRISGTPGFILGGESFTGAHPIEYFRERIAAITGEPVEAPANDTAAEPTEGEAQ